MIRTGLHRNAALAAVLLCICSFVAAQEPAAPEQLPTFEERTAATIDFYRSAWETWLSEVDFQGDYTVVSSTDSKFQEGSMDVEPYREVPGRIEDQGRFLKLGEWVRQETRPPSPLTEILLADGSTGLSSVPSISITNGQVDMDFMFDPRETPEHAKLTEFVTIKHRLAEARSPYSPSMTRGILSPLTLGTPGHKAFEMPTPRTSGEVKSSPVIVKYGGQTGVRLVDVHPDGSRFSKELRFDDGHSPPRLVAFTCIFESAGNRTYMDVRLDEFVKCGDHFAPKSVRQQISTSAGSPTLLRQWLCRNLGETTPALSDFVLTVDKSVKIRGLRVLPPIIDSKRSIDLTKIDDQQVYDGPMPLSEIVDPSKPSEVQMVSRNRFGPWLTVLNLILLTVVVVVWICKRKAGKSDPSA